MDEEFRSGAAKCLEIAKMLLERCIADMKAQDIVGIHLITANESFLPDFYERHGFGREKEVILMGMEL